MEKIIPEIQSDLRRIDLLAAEIRGMTTMLAKPMVLDNEMLDQMVESLRSEASMLSKKIEVLEQYIIKAKAAYVNSER